MKIKHLKRHLKQAKVVRLNRITMKNSPNTDMVFSLYSTSKKSGISQFG